MTILFHTLANSAARGVTGHAPRRNLRTLKSPPLPPLNFHRARVRRNHGRPPPNGFIERARRSLLPLTTSRQRTSDKVLALIRHLDVCQLSDENARRLAAGSIRPTVLIFCSRKCNAWSSLRQVQAHGLALHLHYSCCLFLILQAQAADNRT